MTDSSVDLSVDTRWRTKMLILLVNKVDFFDVNLVFETKFIHYLAPLNY